MMCASQGLKHNFITSASASATAAAGSGHTGHGHFNTPKTSVACCTSIEFCMSRRPHFTCHFCKVLVRKEPVMRQLPSYQQPRSNQPVHRVLVQHYSPLPFSCCQHRDPFQIDREHKQSFYARVAVLYKPLHVVWQRNGKAGSRYQGRTVDTSGSGSKRAILGSCDIKWRQCLLLLLFVWYLLSPKKTEILTLLGTRINHTRETAVDAHQHEHAHTVAGRRLERTRGCAPTWCVISYFFIYIRSIYFY